MRKNESEHIGKVIDEYFEALKLRGKLNQFKAKKQWGEIMGPTVAAQTKKVYFKERTLYVHLGSPVLKNELLMMKTAIVKMINKNVNAEVVKDIVFR